MYRWARISTAAACLAVAFGCDEQTEVQRQTRDLQEAQKNIGKVTQELESELAKSKADVIRLEQKLAMARQGITDDVLENQKELQEALKAQEQKVQSELGEAKREAQIHNRDTEAALKQLGQATTPPASGEVAAPVEGTPVPPVTPTDMPTRDDMVPVRGGPDPQPDGTVDIDRGVTPAPTPAQPVDPTGAVPPPPPVVPPATSTTTSTTKSTTTVPASPSGTAAESAPPSAPPPSAPPPSDMPPPPAPPAP